MGANSNPAQELIFQNSLAHLDELERALVEAKIDLRQLGNLEPEMVKSALDGYDYLFSIIFGILGTVITSSRAISAFCGQIHTDSSRNNPKTLLGKILHHNGDAIDKVNGKFVNRSGAAADLMFHRVLYGHDILSFGPDNPFYVLTKQHGLLRGTLQVFRHLIADTFSVQGLPIPGHSWLDYTENGKTTNVLKKISESVSINGRQGANEAFFRMFTIKAQDIGAGGLVWATSKAYIHCRPIEDETRQRQFKILSYGTCFLANVAYGLVTVGVPNINWIIFQAFLKEVAGLVLHSNRETAQLEQITSRIVAENAALEQKVFATGRSLVSYSSGQAYLNELVEHEQKLAEIIDFWEED